MRVICFFLIAVCAVGRAAPPADARAVLAARCLHCHGPETQKSGLRLDTPAHLLLGGNGGPAIELADLDESALLRAIRHDDDMLQMPPSGKLPEDERRSIERWVLEGGIWAGASPRAIQAQAAQLLEARKREDEALWALRPVQRPPLPDVHDVDWPRNPLDAFILAALEAQHLSPSPEADPRRLIRRVYLDMLGLPPTPDEVDAFLHEFAQDPAAYDRLVDRVLASPQYGERWARHWLDVVRFAETHGFETNTPRNNAWPFRDYVIEALNNDLPYTQFVREQLAGDALGVDAATGFLVAGPWDEVKSPDIVLTRNQRDGELHDMVSTTGSAFLGMTVGCAKCHHHKFDPVSQQDYFALRAVFEGVHHGERELRSADAEVRLAEAAVRREDLARVETRLRRFIRPADVSSVTPEMLAEAENTQTELQVRPAASTIQNIERFSPIRARYVRFTIYATNGAEPCLDELEVWTAEEEPRNVAAASAGGVPSASSEYPGSDKHRIVHLNDGRRGNSHSWIPAPGDMGWAQITLPEASLIDTVVWGRDHSAAFRDRIPTRYAVEVAETPDDWRLVASSWDRAPRSEAGHAISPYSVAPEEEAAFEALHAEKQALEAEIKRLTNFASIYAGRFEQPEYTRLLYRGDPMMERQVISPGGMRYVGPALHLGENTPEQARRLALADWIASEHNPLTARVMVNRIWQHHFGRGIVATPSDFGAMGTRPTHPDLLDWLAAEFMETGWRMKHLHRLILRSNTYRQSSAPREDALAVDAGARWLWRFPPRRLEAEPIRDSILQISGVLDTTMGGPGYQVFEPNDNYVRVYTPKTEYTPAEWRRMIYQNKPRSQQDITFGAFDCPDGGQTAPRRNVSTTPLQALNLLNSPFMVQQAQLLAERLKAEAGDRLEDRIARAFALVFNRSPQDAELRAASQLIQDHGLTAFCRALYNTNEFLYLE